jgi:hypothetical protein
VTVLMPDGTELTSGTFSTSNCTGGAPASPCAGWAGSTTLNLGRVPFSGTYTVLVQQRNAAGQGTVSVTVSTPITSSMSINPRWELLQPCLGKARYGLSWEPRVSFFLSASVFPTR